MNTSQTQSTNNNITIKITTYIWRHGLGGRGIDNWCVEMSRYIFQTYSHQHLLTCVLICLSSHLIYWRSSKFCISFKLLKIAVTYIRRSIWPLPSALSQVGKEVHCFIANCIMVFLLLGIMTLVGCLEIEEEKHNYVPAHGCIQRDWPAVLI